MSRKPVRFVYQFDDGARIVRRGADHSYTEGFVSPASLRRLVRALKALGFRRRLVPNTRGVIGWENPRGPRP